MCSAWKFYWLVCIDILISHNCLKNNLVNENAGDISTWKLLLCVMGSCRHQLLAFIRWLHLSIFKPILHVQLLQKFFSYYKSMGSQHLNILYILWKKLALVVPRFGFQRRTFDFINVLSIHWLHMITNLTFYCQVFNTCASGSKYTHCG